MVVLSFIFAVIIIIMPERLNLEEVYSKPFALSPWASYKKRFAELNTVRCFVGFII
jgi:hypothetical protein